MAARVSSLTIAKILALERSLRIRDEDPPTTPCSHPRIAVERRVFPVFQPISLAMVDTSLPPPGPPQHEYGWLAVCLECGLRSRAIQVSPGRADYLPLEHDPHVYKRR